METSASPAEVSASFTIGPMPERLVVKPTPSDLFIDHGESQEMRWEAMADQGYTVANECFFVRNLGMTPRIDASRWSLAIEGAVEHPYALTYEALRALPAVTVARAIECAGNGRSFFELMQRRKIEGTQWKLGGIGVAEWTGVPLRALLERAVLRPSARTVMAVGGDERQVRRPLPLAKTLADDTLVVHRMNGEPLPPDHGFPARLLVPGWVGIANIKWLTRLEIADAELRSFWNTEQYVIDGTPLTKQNVKAALELAWPAALRAGPRLIRGRAWSGLGAIASVEYQVDDDPYRAARLVGENLPSAWVRFEFEWRATEGEHTIRVRATDTNGDAQPDAVPFNTLGYLYDGVVPHPVRVTG